MKSGRLLMYSALLAWAVSVAACHNASSNPPAESGADTPAAASDAARSSGPKAAPAASKPAAVVPIVVPENTTIRVALIDSIATDRNQSGDTFEASLAEPVMVGGKVAVDKGVRVRGRITSIEDSGRVKGRAHIAMVLTEIEGSGGSVAIATSSFSAEAQPDRKRDATMAAIGAGAGAVVGGLIGGKKGAVIGGAGGGTGAVLATKGKELRYPSETRLSFKLREPLTIASGRPIS